MKTITFNISEEAFELLNSIKKSGYAEYRDTKYETLEDFKNSNDKNYQSEESFLARNHNGTYYLVEELLKYNLIDSSEDAWHVTYVLTDFGKQVTK